MTNENENDAGHHLILKLMDGVKRRKDGEVESEPHLEAEEFVEETTTKIIESEEELISFVYALLSKRHAPHMVSDEDRRKSSPIHYFDVMDLYLRSQKSLRRTKLILAAFDQSYQEMLILLQRASDSADFAELKKRSHALKGLLLDVGAKLPGSYAEMIEINCAHHRYKEALELVPDLIDQVEFVGRLVHELGPMLPAKDR